MVRLSVREAAERLGVSQARVRQRIGDGSVPAEKIGGRWLVHLAPSDTLRPSQGRPVGPGAVWSALAELPNDPVLEGPPSGGLDRTAVSAAARRRAMARLRADLAARDSERLVAWLRQRAERRVFVVPAPEMAAVRGDQRLVLSGLSHPGSRMSDPGLVEAYAARSDVQGVIDQHWLEPAAPGENHNVILHVAPLRPGRISRLLIAADLAEHGGPRERQRAGELMAEVAAELEQSGERR